MSEYAHYGFDEFIICAGYRQDVIKKYFAHYYLTNSDITFDFKNGNRRVTHEMNFEPWKVTVVDTGLNTMTGGRIKRVAKFIGDEPFMLTYGDGVCDVQIDKILEFHKSHGKKVTMTAVKPEGRFGILDLEGDKIASFREKSKQDVGFINGGYMVCEPEVIDYIDDDATTFEREPLEKLADEGELMAFRHRGFWQCMDTLRDHQKLEAMWKSGQAPWKVWQE